MVFHERARVILYLIAVILCCASCVCTCMHATQTRCDATVGCKVAIRCTATAMLLSGLLLHSAVIDDTHQ
jgi:hypothetical protein